jgi:predicted dehydrogenase
MSNIEQSRRKFLKVLAGAGATLALAGNARGVESTTITRGSALKFKPLETVRTAFIGVGDRGSSHLGRMMTLEGVEIAAIADNYEPSLSSAVERVKKAGRKEPAAYGNGDEDYKRMLERDDIDIIIIATPWEWHARMCVDAMKAGKHAFTEVPAGITVDECWELVDTAEKTQKHCMMMENCCYGREELFCLNLCRLGLLGELLHGEAAYLHDLREQMNEVRHGTGSWRTWHYAKRNGNLYPTHGLGPVAQYMGINRGDRFDYLSSVSSPALGRAEFAKANFPAEHQWNKVSQWKCGDICTTIIKTALGRSILVQWNETSPRPYSRLNLIQGTRGIFAGYPSRLAIEGVTPSTHEWVEGESLKQYFTKYEHPLWKKMGELAEKSGGHGGMDWLMTWRMVYCLRNGDPLDQDVYDAAAWSAVGPLSEKSIANRSQSIDVPDFTRGRWKSTKPLGIVA